MNAEKKLRKEKLLRLLSSYASGVIETEDMVNSIENIFHWDNRETTQQNKELQEKVYLLEKQFRSFGTKKKKPKHQNQITKDNTQVYGKEII